MLLECGMFQCSIVPMFQCVFLFHSVARVSCPTVHWSIGPLVHWSIGPLDHWSIGQLVHWLNVKCQMSIRLNFCRSVPPEFLRSFFSLMMMLILLTPTKVHLPSSALQTSGPSMKHTIYNWLLSAQCTKIYQIGRCTDSPKRMTRLMLPPPLSPKPRVAHRSGSSLPVRWNPTTQLLQLYTGTDCIIRFLKTLGNHPQKKFSHSIAFFSNCFQKSTFSL